MVLRHSGKGESWPIRDTSIMLGDDLALPSDPVVFGRLSFRATRTCFGWVVHPVQDGGLGSWRDDAAR